MSVNKKPHFDISAHVVKQLGEELVSDEVTALLELVKNAYDADATYVNITVDTSNVLVSPEFHFIPENDYSVKPGYLTLEDDGIGMGQREIEKGWLRISFSAKRKMRERGILTPKRRRVPLGDKGLGRLSTQRLGDRLEIFTHKERNIETFWDSEADTITNEDNLEHHVAFSWSEFTEDRELTAVPVYWDTQTVKSPRQGTKLVITDLRNPAVWTKGEQEKIIQQLSQVISPYEEVRPFNVYLNIDGRRIDLGTIVESLREVAVSSFRFRSYENDHKRDQYLLSIEGKIKFARLGVEAQEYELIQKDDGLDFFNFLTNPTNQHSLSEAEYLGKGSYFIAINQVLSFDSLGGLALDHGEVANPGRFYGVIDEFLFRGVDLDPLGDVFSRFADYRDTVKELIGVKIYRDGFGIRPYGLDGEDWIGFGRGVTSGSSWYGLRPSNVTGFVALSAEDNQELREKTDREGFIDSPYSKNFFRLMEEVRKYTEYVLTNLRRSFTEYKRQEAENLPGFIPPENFVPSARAISRSAKAVQPRAAKLADGLGNTSASVKGEALRIETTPLLVSAEERKLAPVLKEASEKLEQSELLLKELESLLEKLQSLEPQAIAVESKLEILNSQVQDFAELAGLGLTAEALSHEIHNVADNLAERTKAVVNNVRKTSAVTSEIFAYFEYVQSAISALRRQLGHLAPSLRYVREQRDDILVWDFLEDIRSFYDRRLRQHDIAILLDQPRVDLPIYINRGKLTQIFDNLILNSEYWLRDALQKGKIDTGIIEIIIDRPYVRVADNGIGVDPAIERSLFQPFVTMKPKNVGRGLGLFIVKELLDSSGCTIILLPERNQYERRYAFQLDFSSVITNG